MTSAVFIDWVTFTIHRISSHALLNWMDNPALLAIVFC